MKQPLMSKELKKDLSNLSLNIEFLVISVIQGMALQMLAGNVIPILNEGKGEYWLYAITAFVLILVFWSQSIVHALSFIDWPIDLVHTFLYFLASLIEVLSFTYISNPIKWFTYGLAFIIVAGFLYLYDFFIIERQKQEFYKSASGKKLYNHIRKYHLIEMTVLVPSAIIYNAVAIWLLTSNPILFIHNHAHILLASVQTAFSLILLIVSTYSFKTRSELISAFKAES